MSIAEKLLVVGNNLVTESEEITEQESLLQQVNAALEGKTSSSGYSKGYEAGKKAEYDAFWDVFQKNGNRTDYAYAFAMASWTADNYKPKYPITATASNSIYYAYYWCILTDTIVPITASNLCNYAFFNARQLKRIPSLIFDGVTSAVSMFNNCNALEDITIGGSIEISLSFAQSSLLTDESVQSIIDHLADLTGATTQTLTFHATVGAKLTDEQKATIASKNWTLAY